MSGRSWARAELFGTDSDGRRIPTKSPDWWLTGITPRPTKNHALSHPERENPAELDQQALMCARLTAEEQAIFDFQAFGWKEDRQHTVPIEELNDRLEHGWDYVSQENGMVIVTREFIVRPTNADIAAKTGLSIDQVRRRVTSAHRKIRAAKEGLR